MRIVLTRLDSFVCLSRPWPASNSGPPTLPFPKILSQGLSLAFRPALRLKREFGEPLVARVSPGHRFVETSLDFTGPL